MLPLPPKYSWLYDEKAPKILLEALKHYGTLEHPGHGSNPNILEWAKELDVIGWYTDDAIPWCGLFVGVVVKRCEYELPEGPLAAIHWAKFGVAVPKGQEMLWDILVFSRTGGNHVCFYVAENDTHFLVYGGNQSNAVGFALIDKTRLIAARRCKWKVAQPANIRKIFVNDKGELISSGPVTEIQQPTITTKNFTLSKDGKKVLLTITSQTGDTGISLEYKLEQDSLIITPVIQII